MSRYLINEWLADPSKHMSRRTKCWNAWILQHWKIPCSGG